MANLDRRTIVKSAAATAALFVCEAIAKPVTDVLVPLQACGCPRIHELTWGHHCTTHDEKGKRWDAYTIEDIIPWNTEITTIESDDDGVTCYGYCCQDSHDMKKGERGIWRRTSYEGNEAEFECLEGFRLSWLNSVQTDYIAMAKESGI